MHQQILLEAEAEVLALRRQLEEKERYLETVKARQMGLEDDIRQTKLTIVDPVTLDTEFKVANGVLTRMNAIKREAEKQWESNLANVSQSTSYFVPCLYTSLPYSACHNSSLICVYFACAERCL
jgi:hypothetical protein